MLFVPQWGAHVAPHDQPQPPAPSNQPPDLSTLTFVAHYVIRVARNAGIVALFIVAAMLGILSGVMFAYADDLLGRRREKGARMLTQQVARNLDQFGLNKQKLFERKVREAILAIQIEKRYTKKEIFTIYCNQMYLGHGAYGVEAASRLYFNKTNKQLALEEAALIAGIFQTLERQSPFVDMKRATSRRNVVLQRMADERYITQAQADAAKEKQ